MSLHFVPAGADHKYWNIFEDLLVGQLLKILDLKIGKKIKMCHTCTTGKSHKGCCIDSFFYKNKKKMHKILNVIRKCYQKICYFYISLLATKYY